MDGINFRNVNNPKDFLLFEYLDGSVESEYYSRDGELKIATKDFFAEIFLDITLDLDEIFNRERILFEASTDNYFWYLLIDEYSYLVLKAKDEEIPLAKIPMPLSLFAKGPTARLGVVIANPGYIFRDSKWRDEALSYCRTLLLWAPDAETPFKQICDATLKDFNLSPVPARFAVPENTIVKSVKAFNTSKHELFELEDNPGGATAQTDFQDASRIFSFWNTKKQLLEIFTGPEFVRSDSYWLFCKISGAKAGETLLRINHIFGYAKRTPGMAPRFFWSQDRVKWEECLMLEPVDTSGNYYPLLQAPAKEFYLSTAIPFLTFELGEMFDNANNFKFVDRKTLGLSVGGNEIHLLKLTDRSVPDAEKHHIALIIGQHSPMEMVGAHFISPIIEYLAETPELLKRNVYYFVPIVNIDCAVWGSDGLNLNKRNTNRCWFDDIQPETRCVMDYFENLPHKIDSFVDIHAGGLWRNHTLLRMSPDFFKERFPETSAMLIEKQTRFNKLLEQHAGIRYKDGMDHVFRNCCAKDWFKITYPDCVSCDLELSTCTWFDPRDGKTKPLTQESLSVVGKGFVKAISEM
jgi:hypothetical protein